MPLRIKRNTLLIIVLMLWGTAAFGQSYPMLHFTLENGLPSNTVYNIYRDSKGFLWISTDKGVARFNGAKFEKFTTFDGLADNEIFYATEDKQNRIWFGTFNGKLCYYKDGTFHNPGNTPFLRQKDKHSHTARVFLEKDSSVSISYLDPYYFCNITKDKCTEIQFRDKKDELSYANIALIEKKNAGRYKIIVSGRELIVNTWGATPKVVSNNPLPELGRFGHSGRMQDEPWIFYHDSVWCTSDFKIIKKYPGGTSIDRFFPQMTHVDKLGNIFHLTEQGVYLNDSIHFLSEERTSSMTQDLNGNHWVSVLNSGIYCLHKNFLNYNLYSKAYKGKILYATEIEGKLFFYTDEHQLCTFDNGISKTLFKSGLDPKERQPGGMGFFLDTNFAFYGFIGHLNFVVPNVLRNTSLAKRYYYSLMGDRHSIKEILKSNNRLYINTGFGMRSLNLANYANEHIVNCIKLPDARGERIFAMAKSDDGSIWYSTIDSVFKAQGDVGIAQNQVKGVAFKNFDFFGKTLVGITHDNQLLIYGNQNGHFNKYSISEGNIWENLYGIDSTHVLISTNGLYYLLTLTLANGNSPYSLIAVENAFIPLGAEAICVGKNDFFFFKNGDITKIKKSELLNKAGVPVLYFTNIKTGTNSARIKGPVKLPYETGNITILFSSLSFDVQDPIYQYSLSRDGKDNWINVKGDINLANLRFGSYVLKVRGKSLSNDFGSPIMLDLTILRPFWATWWFISASVCVVGLIVWLIIRRRIQATVIKKEKEHENHVRFIKSEYKAMNALMNPHFVFNSINNVQSLVNNHDVLNATEYLGIFADLIRQNMHNISNDVIPLQKEIDLVENYLLLEKLRFEDQLNYSINIAENMFLTDIMVAPLLLQPLVENSVKHGILPLKSRGRQGYIEINIYDREDILYIEVKDNGIGIAQAKEKQSLHQSYGLTNIKNRINQLSIILGKEMSFELTDVYDENGRPGGTLAVIKMPL